MNIYLHTYENASMITSYDTSFVCMYAKVIKKRILFNLKVLLIYRVYEDICQFCERVYLYSLIRRHQSII